MTRNTTHLNRMDPPAFSGYNIAMEFSVATVKPKAATEIPEVRNDDTPS
jgi:hypothetical protein